MADNEGAPSPDPAPTSRTNQRHSTVDAVAASMIVKNPEGSTEDKRDAEKPENRRLDARRQERPEQRQPADRGEGSRAEADPLRRAAPREGDGEDETSEKATLDALLNTGVKAPEQSDSDSDGDDDDTQDGEGDQETDTGDTQDDDEDDDEAGLLDPGDDDDVGEGEDDEFSLSDDTRITVTVEGKERDVSLADLKKAYSGAGAIEARLQEVSEIRQTGVKQLEENRDTFVRILEGVGELLFKPQTSAPDPRLAESNPMQYLMQKTKHEEEMHGINQSKQNLAAQLAQVYKDVDTAKKAVRAEQTEILREKMPILSDPHHGPVLGKALVKMMVQDYGFSADMVKDTDFHGIFLMAADAMRYRVMQGQQTTFEVKQVTPKLPKKAPKSAVSRRNAQTKQQNAALDRARRSGSVDDVAATMLKPQGKSGRGRRR